MENFKTLKKFYQYDENKITKKILDRYDEDLNEWEEYRKKINGKTMTVDDYCDMVNFLATRGKGFPNTSSQEYQKMITKPHNENNYKVANKLLNVANKLLNNGNTDKGMTAIDNDKGMTAKDNKDTVELFNTNIRPLLEAIVGAFNNNKDVIKNLASIIRTNELYKKFIGKALLMKIMLLESVRNDYNGELKYKIPILLRKKEIDLLFEKFTNEGTITDFDFTGDVQKYDDNTSDDEDEEGDTPDVETSSETSGESKDKSTKELTLIEKSCALFEAVNKKIFGENQ